MLVVTQKDGDVIEIGDNIRVMVSITRKGVVRLAIDAPREIEIKRIPAPVLVGKAASAPPAPSEIPVLKVLHLPSSSVTARRVRPGRS